MADDNEPAVDPLDLPLMPSWHPAMPAKSNPRAKQPRRRQSHDLWMNGKGAPATPRANLSEPSSRAPVHIDKPAASSRIDVSPAFTSVPTGGLAPRNAVAPKFGSGFYQQPRLNQLYLHELSESPSEREARRRAQMHAVQISIDARALKGGYNDGNDVANAVNAKYASSLNKSPSPAKYA